MSILQIFFRVFLWNFERKNFPIPKLGNWEIWYFLSQSWEIKKVGKLTPLYGILKEKISQFPSWEIGKFGISFPKVGKSKKLGN
jgi:hypothetical protein